MNKYQELLTKAKALLVEQGWTQGTYARDELGAKVRYHSPRAVSFCGKGAIYKVEAGGPLRAFHFLNLVCLGQSFVLFNDTPGRTKEEVLAKYDQAIELAGRV